MHDQRGPTRQAERHADIVERERLMQRDEIGLPRSLGEYERKARCNGVESNVPKENNASTGMESKV